MGVVPMDWRGARVVPLYKGMPVLGDLNERAISLEEVREAVP